ncbi:MAG: hypothetical protein H0U57_07185 [Tatlockia sp.]|nr:hypothetical protein [Tatlockia sp.]
MNKEGEVMKLIKIGTAIPLLTALIGCNPTTLSNHNADSIPTASGKFNSVIVYKTRDTLPKNSRLKGIARVQNYYPNGTKVPPEILLEGLKTQAALSGGAGLFNITSGYSQTTADIVSIY